LFFFSYNGTTVTVTALDLRPRNCSFLSDSAVRTAVAVNIAQSPDFDANNGSTTSGIGAGNNRETIERATAKPEVVDRNACHLMAGGPTDGRTGHVTPTIGDRLSRWRLGGQQRHSTMLLVSADRG